MSEAWVQRVRTWTFQSALPLWGEAGVDTVHGGFVEQLDAEGHPVDVGYKRTRAIARQIYVFSHAALLGWREGADIAEQGVYFLGRAARLGSGGGWARTVSTRGDVMDATADLCAWPETRKGSARRVVVWDMGKPRCEVIVLWGSAGWISSDLSMPFCRPCKFSERVTENL